MRDLARLFRRGPTWLCALVLASCAPAEPAQSAQTAAKADVPNAADADVRGADDTESVTPAATSREREKPPPSTAAPKAGGEASAPGHSVDLDSDDNLDADIAELSRQTKGGTEKPAEKNKGRDVVYRVTPKGLVIEVEGIHFRPEVKAVRNAQGAYELVLTLNAESFDERQYWLRKPSEGPLAIAGSVADKAGKSARFNDQREGDGEEVVMAGQPRAFKQRWPGRGQPKLWPGQSVTLEVGLWGVRADSEREHPVRRLFMVKMLATGRPEPVLTPPTVDWGG
jgi:hypothetical protein